MFLTLLILIPIVGIVTIMLLPELTNKILIRKLGLIFSLSVLWLSVFIWGSFEGDGREVQYISDVFNNEYYPIKLSLDGLSIYFVLLTTFIFPIALLSNWENLDDKKVSIKYYVILMLLIEFLLLLVFTVSDILLFYIFFESILPPLFVLIGMYGSTRKIQASFYIFLYTFLGSIFMLLSFTTIYWVTGIRDIQLLKDISLDVNLQKILWIGIFFALAVKTPLVPLHLWLPLAHAESPLGGSVILAGIVLKLSLYGILRILIPILPEASLYYTPLVYLICVITIIYSSLTTLRQSDLKVIIAYSSIGHMAICTLGAFSNTLDGIEGSILLAIAHGLVSPALFVSVGGILYDRTHTRALSYYRGLLSYMPIFSIMFFIFSLCNIAVPFSANFVGEFLIFSGAFQRMPVLTVLASISIVLSAGYGIWLYIRLIGGSYSPYLGVLPDMTRREIYLMLPLLFLTIVLGINPNIVLDIVHGSITSMLY
nr:NADH dehydrogenase subunit 4 [Pneumocystis sp. 'ludovicianus']